MSRPFRFLLPLAASEALLAAALVAQSPAPSVSGRIEQRVLAKELEASIDSLTGVAVSYSQAKDAGEQDRLRVSMLKHASWLQDLEAQLDKSGPPVEDTTSRLTACAGRLNDLAWYLVTQPRAAGIPRSLAQDLAGLAVHWNEGAPGLRDTHARALALNGAMDQAIAEEQKAIDSTQGGPEAATGFSATLAAYREGRIPEVNLANERDFIAEKAEEQASDDKSVRLNQIAWRMATSSTRMSTQAIAVARIALIYCRKSGSEKSRILYTEARAMGFGGGRKNALSVLEDAIDFCDEGDPLKGELEETLKAYRKGIPSRFDERDSRVKPDFAADGTYLNRLAWELVAGNDRESQAVGAQRAMTLAQAAIYWDADAGSQPRQVTYHTTYARAVCFNNGAPQQRSEGAIAAQQEALEIAAANPGCVSDAQVAKMQGYLEAYKKNQLPAVSGQDAP